MALRINAVMISLGPERCPLGLTRPLPGDADVLFAGSAEDFLGAVDFFILVFVILLLFDESE